uniref:Uncharacterized protein n=1 Tax=Salix viminalis TaxID=40686 RepID=A0A6N2ND62_SALVM
MYLTRIAGDNHRTGGYPWLCSDLQNIQPADQVQKKALPMKKTSASPQRSMDLFIITARQAFAWGHFFFIQDIHQLRLTVFELDMEIDV